MTPETTASALPLNMRPECVMAEYRFYFFRSQTILFDLQSCDCGDDASAIADAHKLLTPETHIEIWERDRKVAVVPADKALEPVK